MAIRPRFGALSMEEGSALLQGLYQLDIAQLQRGVPPILGALVPDANGARRLRYIRSDPGEHWRSVKEIWRYGGGDCEDLAAAVAAELTLAGEPAIPIVYRVSPTLAHVVVKMRDGSLRDPSRLGGMGGRG